MSPRQSALAERTGPADDLPARPPASAHSSHFQIVRIEVDALPAGEPLLISRVTWMEFAVGYETKAEADAESRRFTVVEFDSELWFPASRISRDLSRRGQRIGTPDCMIAATAIAYDQSVVTLNHAHFSRIAGLRVEAL